MSLFLDKGAIFSRESLGVLARGKKLGSIKYFRINLLWNLLLNFMTKCHYALSFTTSIDIVIVKTKKANFICIAIFPLIKLR
ncbi:hypothetical protein FGO68_gene5361 [Halteria grandinella]|uniref:Uncharacterized protein n=1 Tax=Halteria grandinella TaxID=5974 RepID=A0A8J8P8V2_HALGN|nr:hypothetical protein FGO68_gene5361 [Halteria grandinella]